MWGFKESPPQRILSHSEPPSVFANGHSYTVQCNKLGRLRNVALLASFAFSVLFPKEPGPQGNLADSQAFGVLNQGHSPTIKRNAMITAFVARLLFPCSPSAIVFAIWAVIVFAVKGMFGRWTWPHVFIKILERLQPALANCNASASVVGVSAALRNQTPLQHLLINIVLAIVRMAGDYASATALRGQALYKAVFTYRPFCTAGAATQPGTFRLSPVRQIAVKLDNGPLAKGLTSKITYAKPFTHGVQL